MVKPLSSASYRRNKLLALVIVSSIACVGAYFTFDASAASKNHGTIFFEGDSITALYSNNPKSDHKPLHEKPQGYWSKLATKLKLSPVTNAQGGSGFLKKGELRPREKPKKMCNGTNFNQRLSNSVKKKIKKAKIVVIEGGRNDFHFCNDKGTLVKTSTPDVEAAVNNYMDKILELKKSDPKSVYVITPWGEKNDQHNRDRITDIVRKSANAHGFQFISTNNVLDPNFKGQNTFDGIHPDSKGTTALSNAILQRSDIEKRARR